MKHALVIENNLIIAMMIEENLLEHGYDTVEIATSQEQASELATARRPYLITVDEKLTAGTGVKAIREICRDEMIAVVFITTAPAEIKSLIPSAIIVPKPFAAPLLTAAIEAAAHAPMTW